MNKTLLNIYRCILIVLLITVLSSIFIFSNQDGDTSGNLSTNISTSIVNTFHKNKPNNEKLKLIKIYEGYVRKLAHFSIYALVGLLLSALLCTYNLTQKQIILICLGFGIIYATSDEIHQTFISDRAGKITDVWIDNLGVMCGTYFILIVYEIRRLINESKNKGKEENKK